MNGAYSFAKLGDVGVDLWWKYGFRVGCLGWLLMAVLEIQNWVKKMINKLKAFGVAIALVCAPLSLSAATALNNGDSVTIGLGGTDHEFTGNVASIGGAGSWISTFEAVGPTADGLMANALATIGPINLNDFSGLEISWVSNIDDSVLNSAPVVAFPDATELQTTFVSPFDLVQRFEISWQDSEVGAAFEFEISVVPVPAAGFLLVGALGALGIARRRKVVS